VRRNDSGADEGLLIFHRIQDTGRGAEGAVERMTELIQIIPAAVDEDDPSHITSGLRRMEYNAMSSVPSAVLQLAAFPGFLNGFAVVLV
jgi:hypothetical protein